MKKLVFLLFLIVKIIYAQDGVPNYITNFADFTPVTPNAANFLIYGNTPVNHATGIPQINIPLFTIEEDGLSIPISLSYHASGIKVDDLASSVGLKWSLNAGGGIFRQINDKPDGSGWLNANTRDYLHKDWYVQNDLTLESTQQNLEISAGAYDYYPDDFNFNFNGQSGAFIFNRDGTIGLEKKQPVKIFKIQGVGQTFGFKAINPSGVSFIFDHTKEYNTKKIISGIGSNLNFNRSIGVTGWMLDQIITKNKKAINFEYIPYEFQYQLKNVAHTITHTERCKLQTIVQPDRTEINIRSGSCGCEGSTNVMEVPVYSTYFQTTSVIHNPVNQLISKIETDKARVSFNYLEDPTLSTWKNKLTSIMILDKLRNKTKSFLFSYSKFTGDPRLRLDKVQEIGFDGVRKTPYQFEYFTGDLPEKGSTAKDFLGYYNGKNENETLIPFSIKAYSKLPPNYLKMVGDRMGDFNSMKHGLIKKIFYPTGGSTSFEFEANSEITTEYNFPIVQNNPDSVFPEYNDNLPATGSTTFTKEFTINNNLIEGIGTVLNYTTYSELCNYDELNPSIDCSKWNIYRRLSNGSLSPSVFNSMRVIGPKDGSIMLEKGTYVLELTVENSDLVQRPYMGVDIWWTSEEPPSSIPRKVYTGGLRINKIIDSNEKGEIAKTTEYSYQGLTKNRPAINDYIQYYAVKTVFSSNEISSDPRYRRSGYLYDKVIIQTKGEKDSLKTVEYFSPYYSNKHIEPLLTRKEIYRENDLIKTIDNQYDSETDNSTEFWVLGDKDFCISKDYYLLNDNPQYFGFNAPDLYTYYHKKNILSKRTEVDYYSKSGEPLEASIKISNYQYNEDLQIKKVTSDGRYYVTNEQDLINKNYSFLSDGVYSELLYTYPRDHQNSNPTITTLLNNYQVGLPISKKVKVNSQLTQGQYLDYDTNGNVIGDYRYNKGKASNNAAVGHIPSTYELYETYSLINGKPIEIKRKDGLPTAVLWDTTHSYVLAQLIGASKSDLASITGAIDLKTTTDLQLKTLYNNLRIALPQAQITTYIHNPLKGVVQITDRNGYVTSYDYDGLSRLIRTKDQDNFLLLEQKYHYMNQN